MMRRTLFFKQAALTSVGIATTATLSSLLGLSPLANAFSLAIVMGTGALAAYNANKILKENETQQKEMISGSQGSLLAEQINLVESHVKKVFRAAHIDPPVIHFTQAPITMGILPKYSIFNAQNRLLISQSFADDLIQKKISTDVFKAVVAHEAHHAKAMDHLFRMLSSSSTEWLKNGADVQYFINFITIACNATSFQGFISEFSSLILRNIYTKGIISVASLFLLLLARQIEQLQEHASDVYSAELLGKTAMIEGLKYLHRKEELLCNNQENDISVFTKLLVHVYDNLFTKQHPEIEQRIKLLEDFQSIPDQTKQEQSLIQFNNAKNDPNKPKMISTAVQNKPALRRSARLAAHSK